MQGRCPTSSGRTSSTRARAPPRSSGLRSRRSVAGRTLSATSARRCAPKTIRGFARTNRSSGTRSPPSRRAAVPPARPRWPSRVGPERRLRRLHHPRQLRGGTAPDPRLREQTTPAAELRPPHRHGHLRRSPIPILRGGRTPRPHLRRRPRPRPRPRPRCPRSRGRRLLSRRSRPTTRPPQPHPRRSRRRRRMRTMGVRNDGAASR